MWSTECYDDGGVRWAAPSSLVGSYCPRAEKGLTVSNGASSISNMAGVRVFDGWPVAGSISTFYIRIYINS